MKQNMTVLSNASPLILYARIHQLHLLKELFREIIIPPEIMDEVIRKGKPGEREIASLDWIIQQPVKDRKRIEILSQGSLSVADASLIVLAKEKPTDLVIIDDKHLRNAAKRESLSITGSGGILVRAKESRLIQDIKPLLNNLIQEGLRISRGAYQQILEAAGEWSEPS